METVNWKVEGMSCSACAQTINGFLEKKGMKDVRVSLTAGEAHFQNVPGLPEQELKKGIEGLGYHVTEETSNKKHSNKFVRYLTICVPLTLILQLHMLGHVPLFHWLMNPWVQLVLCLPVYVTGMYYFGRSAVHSLLQRSTNMNVLIALGATAAFLYSLTEPCSVWANLIFFMKPRRLLLHWYSSEIILKNGLCKPRSSHLTDW